MPVETSMKSGESQVREDHNSSGIVRQGGISLLGAVVGGALVIVNEILAARFLGIHYYGCYALGHLAARFCEIASLVGVHVGVVHFIPLYLLKEQYSRITGAILSAAVLPLAASTAWIVVLWHGSPWLAMVVLKEPDAIPYLRCFAFAIPLLSLSDLLGHVTRGYGIALYHVLVRNLVPPAVYFAALLILIFYSANRLWIAAGFFGAYLLAVLVGVASVVRVVGPTLWRVRPANVWGELYSYSFPIVINSLLYVALSAVDLVMISALRTTEEVSVYRGALQFVSVFQVIIAAFNGGAAHVFSVLSQGEQRSQLDRSYGTTSRWITATTLVACVTIFLNRVELLALLGSKFTVGGAALGLLLFGQMIRSCTGAAPVLLVLSRHQKVETFNVTLGLLLNVSLNLLLIPKWGIIGAATATTTTYFVMSALQLIQVRYYLALPTIRRATIRCLAVGATVIGVVWLLELALGWNNAEQIWAIVFRIPIVALVTLTGVWKFGLEPEDHEIIKTAVRPN